MRNNRTTRSALFNGNTRHSLPRCAETGLARHRDRQQARDAIKSICSGSKDFTMSSFKCHACKGFHLETAAQPRSAGLPSAHLARASEGRKRRYMLIDIENMFGGKRRTPEEVSEFWAAITQHAPGIFSHDHVVIGAGRGVAKHYRHLITGPNIKWVIGANAADGADQALLASINMHQVAKKFDEIVIMSGDHAFTQVALQARKRGLTVQLVTVESVKQNDNRARSLMSAVHTRTVVRLKPRSAHARAVEGMRRVADATHSRAAQALAA